MIKSNLIIEDQKEFWFLKIPPVISIILIILFPPIFGTISLYPRLSSNKNIKLLQIIMSIILFSILTFILNIITRKII